ncbi:receptor-type tyrosine-protein phosphatase epsilon-like isoform X2 [Hydra vulgaris]|uniref:Receptor-type tyrosine-protein phosphatase epsilon-like isoform X2 n=1 Tax=Hydra vulgaris TaxID=6087 RepID=A0ABM4D7P0_HYDVU
MKINMSTIIKNATSTYKDFKVYETADYNEPYIAALFNASMYEKYRNFVLGNNEVFSTNSSTKEFQDNQTYKNGKLVAGQTYTLFQRIILDDDQILTSPWFPEFTASTIDSSSLIEKMKASYDPYLFALVAIPIFVVILIAFLIKRRKKVDEDSLAMSKEMDNISNQKSFQNQGEDALISSEPYLNAVFVDGYKKKKAFIATQCPLQTTVTEFWDVLKKLNVSTIVYLTSHCEQKEKSYYKFYPSDCDLKLNGITVKLTAEEKLESITKRNLSVSTENETIMCMLEFSFWSENCLPSFDLILQLISEVTKSQQCLGNDIIAVVCNNGVSRSGTFISCINAIEQSQIEELVDVFQIVRRAQLSQPQFVQNLLQYEFVYKLVKHYLETFSTYSNFK